MRTLSQPLRRRINQLAHRLAAEHALKMKDMLNKRLVGMAVDGAGYEALAAELDRMESGGVDPHFRPDHFWKPPGSSFAENFPC